MDTSPAPQPSGFPALPRRRLLLSATAVAGTLVLGSVTPVAWAAPTGTASITPLPATQDVATTDGTTVTVPVVLGGALTVSGGTLAQGTRITLTWASALYQPEAAPGLTKDTQTFACSYEAPPSDDGTTGSVSIILDTEIAEDMYVLTVGSVRALTFPDDLIAPPAATTIVLEPPDGPQETVEEPVVAGTITDTLWGASIGASWKAECWRDGYHLWNPVDMSIAAVGPAAVPAGTLLDVQVDAAAFAELQVGPADTAASGTVDGRVLRATYTLPSPIEPQSILTVPVSATTIELSGELTDYQPHLLALANPDASGTQRLTGLESTTREDHATDADTRERFGMP